MAMVAALETSTVATRRPKPSAIVVTANDSEVDPSKIVTLVADTGREAMSSLETVEEVATTARATEPGVVADPGHPRTSG